jgi:cobalt transporter subunit CbtA
MMLFRRLVWCALLVALAVGSLQWIVQRWQAVPIILAAEAFEGQKAPVQAALDAHAHTPEEAAHAHHHDVDWTPADGLERSAWTWVANLLNAFALALLVLAAMGAWAWQRGMPAGAGTWPIAAAVAATGWLSLHLWPSLGLPAEVPGMEAADLRLRQLWWLLAAGSALSACALVAFGRKPWRWVAAAAWLALPFVIGAPQLIGDPLGAFNGEAHQRLQVLGRDFVLATHVSASLFWLSMGVVAAPVFKRWLVPLLDRSSSAAALPTGSLA